MRSESEIFERSNVESQCCEQAPEGAELKFIYRDNLEGGKVVFECKAKGILEADKIYRQSTGQDPAKQNHIGCSFEMSDEETPG